MAGKIPSKSGSKISMKQAKELAESFQKKFKLKNKSTYYSRDVFERLLSLPGCVGIRIYPGIENDTFAPILVGVNSDGDNLYSSDPATSTKLVITAEELGLTAMEERGSACPPYCASNDFF